MSREFYNLTPEEARKQVNGKETPLSAEESTMRLLIRIVMKWRDFYCILECKKASPFCCLKNSKRGKET